MTMTTINYSEAKEEAERLSRMLKRDVEVKPVTCDCGYTKGCYQCAGEGIYYELVYVSCGHVVPDGNDEECDENDCINREYLAAVEREEAADSLAA